ncbi:MAG: tetratricopeptide repeat protein [Gemmatimonadales bacterium]
MVSGPPPSEDLARHLRELLAQGRFPDTLEAYRARVGSAEARRPETQLLAATAATRVGDLEAATTLAAEALERFRGRVDDDGQMRALNLLGAISFERGELGQAVQSFDGALSLARRLEDSLMMARLANNLASVLHLRGDLAAAASLYRSALTSYQRLGHRHFIAETWHNLGVTFRLVDAWTEAENAAGEAVRHAELVDEPSLLALTVSGQAEIRLERGETDLAAQGIERAARLASEAGDEIGSAEARRLRAVLAYRRGDYAQAVTAATLALEAGERHRSALLRTECAATLALATRALGRTAEAGRWREEALKGYGRLGAEQWRARFERDWDRAATPPRPPSA